VLAPFALTRALLDSVSDRVVNVASLSASGSCDVSDDMHLATGHRAYSLSKLCNQVFTYQLAGRLAGRGAGAPTANCLDPGTVNTKMLLAGWGPCGIPLSDADSEHWLATSPAVEGVSGRYFVSDREAPSPRVSYDVGVQERLWAMWERQTGVAYD